MHTYVNMPRQAPQVESPMQLKAQSVAGVRAQHGLTALTDGNSGDAVIQRRTISPGRGGNADSGEVDDSGAQEDVDRQGAVQVYLWGLGQIQAAREEYLRQQSGQDKKPDSNGGSSGGYNMEVTQFAAAATGAFNRHAAKVPGGIVNVNNATLNWGNVTAQNTSTTMTSIDLYTHPGGAGVGATRPNNWATFVAMIGGTNPYVQGHTLHQSLGGDGNHDNLSPFTKSLNSVHYHAVEKHVLAHTTTDYANYDVTVNYATNPTVAGDAILLYNAMVATNAVGANAAMVAAGVITPLQAAANVPPIVPVAIVPLVQQALAHTWITNYVNATFGSGINCSVTFFDTTNAGNVGAPHQAVPQHVTITNT